MAQYGAKTIGFMENQLTILSLRHVYCQKTLLDNNNTFFLNEKSLLGALLENISVETFCVFYFCF